MASKWAQALAESKFGAMGGSNLVNRIAEALDAAYREGVDNAVQRIESETGKIRKLLAELEGKT